MRRTRPGSPIDSAFTSRYLREIVVCRFESSRCSRDENGGGATGDDDFVDLDHPNSHHFSFVKREDKSPKIARERTRDKSDSSIDAENLAQRKSKKIFLVHEDKARKNKKERKKTGQWLSRPIEGKSAREKGPFLFSLSVPLLPSSLYCHGEATKANERR